MIKLATDRKVKINRGNLTLIPFFVAKLKSKCCKLLIDFPTIEPENVFLEKSQSYHRVKQAFCVGHRPVANKYL